MVVVAGHEQADKSISNISTGKCRSLGQAAVTAYSVGAYRYNPLRVTVASRRYSPSSSGEVAAPAMLKRGLFGSSLTSRTANVSPDSVIRFPYRSFPNTARRYQYNLCQDRGTTGVMLPAYGSTGQP
eukprot:3524113-Rhodomonas_salina.2